MNSISFSLANAESELLLNFIISASILSPSTSKLHHITLIQIGLFRFQLVGVCLNRLHSALNHIRGIWFNIHVLVYFTEIDVNSVSRSELTNCKEKS